MSHKVRNFNSHCLIIGVWGWAKCGIDLQPNCQGQGGHNVFSPPCPEDGGSPSFPSQMTRAATWNVEHLGLRAAGSVRINICWVQIVHSAVLSSLQLVPGFSDLLWSENCIKVSGPYLRFLVYAVQTLWNLNGVKWRNHPNKVVSISMFPPLRRFQGIIQISYINSHKAEFSLVRWHVCRRVALGLVAV